MPNEFDATSTADQVLAGVDLAGRRVLVTGVSSGLGVETARALAARGASIVGAARDLATAEPAMAPVREVVTTAGGTVELIQLDLASLASVRACGDRLLADGRPLDLIIANAGVMTTPEGRTEDGFETQFGTNHLGHFVLVNRLARLVPAGGRVIILSSSAHRNASVDLADPNFENRRYNPSIAYGRSKSANALFALEFDRRHRVRGVRAASVHPGVILTNLGRHRGNEQIVAWIDTINQARTAAGIERFAIKTVAQGAATSVWAAAVAPADEIGGRYCEDCAVSPRLIVADEVDAVAPGYRAWIADPELAAALWSKSEAMVGEQFPTPA